MRQILMEHEEKHSVYLHSTLVRVLRYIVPAFIVVFLITVVLWPNFKLSTLYPQVQQAIRQANLVINPRISSVDDQGKPYQIQARSAQRMNELQATLDLPQGQFMMDDGTQLEVSANLGDLKKEEDALKLSGTVNLKSDSGYELNAPSATVDLKSKTAESYDPVSGKGPRGEIESKEGVKISSDGKIVFKGKTRLVINSKQGEG